MADISKTLQKLNQTNYSTWKFKLELLLIKEGLWHVISTAAPNPITSEWTKSNDQARAWIGLSIEDNQLRHVKKAATAKEAWENLQKYHEKSTLSNKVQIMRQICEMKLSDGDNIEDHINQMTNLFDKLDAVSADEDKLSEKWIVAMLLSSLSKSYDTLITALETRPDNDLTFDLVQTKLLEEYRRQMKCEPESSGLSENLAMLTVSSKVQCFFCKRVGHVKRDCRKFQAWCAQKESKVKNDSAKKVSQKDEEVKVTQKEEEDDYCFIVNDEIFSKSMWVIDSAATNHMTNDSKLFFKLSYILKPLHQIDFDVYF